MTLPVYPAGIYGRSYSLLKTPEFDTLFSASPSGTETDIPQRINPLWHFSLIYDQTFNDLTNPAYGVSELELLMGFFGSFRGRGGPFVFEDPEDNSPRGPIAVVSPGSSVGSGFSVGDHLAVLGGGGAGAVLNVDSVAPVTGAITGLSVVSGGAWYATTTNAALQVLTGAGSGNPTANIAAPVTLQLLDDGAGNYYSPLQRSLGLAAYGLLIEDVTDLNPQDGSGLQVWADGAPQTIGPIPAHDCQLLGPRLALPGSSFLGLYLKWAAAPTPPIMASFKFYFRVRFEQDKIDFEKFLYRLWTVGGEEGKRGAGMVQFLTARPPAVL